MNGPAGLRMGPGSQVVFQRLDDAGVPTGESWYGIVARDVIVPDTLVNLIADARHRCGPLEDGNWERFRLERGERPGAPMPAEARRRAIERIAEGLDIPPELLA